MNTKVEQLDDIESFDKPCVLALGMFDGLHRGHRRVMQTALKLADKLGAVPSVLTFSPHPSKVINMGRPPVEMLCSREMRAKMFGEAGAKIVFVKKFDKRFAAKSAESFEKFLRQKFPNLRGLITGENFVFGSGAKGNFKTLSEMAERNGWKYEAVGGVKLKDGRRMSSSLLRDALRAGDLALFKKISGRDYLCEGKIEGGKKLGRTIGFPTLNLPWNPDCKPAFGVYAVRLERAGKTYGGVANYGLNPTVGGTKSPVLETNLFDDVKFGVGACVKVSLLKFLRKEKKFASLDALKKQIAKDKKAAKDFFWK